MPDVVGTPLSQPAVEHAAQLRDGAQRECEQARWRRCLDLLDKADRLDPAGAADAKVERLRKSAEQALREKR